MKKLLLMMLALVMAIFACAGCQKNEGQPGETDPANEKPKFGVISLVENSAFTDMRDGIFEGLKNHGFVDGETAVIDYQCAGGDMGTLATIALFFCAVSGPVAAGVVEDLNVHAENVTGTSNAIPVEDIFALADKLTPGYSKVGLF